MIYDARVSDFVRSTYDWGKPVKFSIVKETLNSVTKKDTILLIFARVQKEQLEFFKKELASWIVYISPECSNSVHPGVSRNTLVIVEKPE